MDSMAVPDCVQQVFKPNQSLLYQPEIYNSDLTPPEYVASLSDPAHPYSDFRPEKQRNTHGGNGAAHVSEKLTITEDRIKAFRQCYDEGSIDSMIEKHGFNPSEYLGLFFVPGLESASSMTVTDQDKKKLSLFLEWAYENRYSFDASEISGNLIEYIEDRSSGIWEMPQDTITLEIMHSYISQLRSPVDKLDKLDMLVRSKDRSPGFILFGSISKSVERYMIENIDSLVNPNLLFNALKQKHQNNYAPSMFIDIVEFLEEWNLTEKYRFKMLHVLELFSASYLKRDMNGTLDAHKSDLQDIYDSLGGKKELFPYQVEIEKPSTEGIIIVRDRGHKHSSRAHNSGVRRIQTHEN